MPTLPHATEPTCNRSGRPIAAARRRGTLRRLAVLSVAGCALVLASCTGEVQPSSYDDTYEENFMLGCTGTDADGEVPGGYEELASRSYCECVYEQLVEKVPFEEAKSFEDAQAEAESGAEIDVPPAIQAIIDDCEGSS